MNEFKSILKILAITTVIFVIWFGLNYTGMSLLSMGIWALSISIILLVVYFLYLKSFNEAEYEELIFSLSYIWRDSISAWVIGSLLATIITSIALIILYKNSSNHSDIFSSNIYNITGLYSGVIFGLLALKSLIDRIAPIHNVQKALELITTDLNQASNKKSTVIRVSFPALNIGQFREDADIYDDHYFANYKTALDKINDNKSADLKVYTFPEALYVKLFLAYGQGFNFTNRNKMKSVVKECTITAKEMAENINKKNRKNSKWFEIHPSSFPPHVIIIDDIVYSIQTWGLPYFINNNFVTISRSTNSKEQLAKIIIYRQKNKKLSELILKEFELCENM